MKKDICHTCREEIDAFNENEYYGINYKVYCSLGCFYEDDKKEHSKSETRRQDPKVQDSPQTNKNDKRKNQVHKKKSKQAKRKRK